MPEVWVVGSLNLDLVARVERFPGPGETLIGRDFHRRPGGKGANQAVAAAVAGAAVRMIGCIGDDEAGRVYRDALGRRGVDTRDVSVREGARTGHAVILVDDGGENSIVVIPGANALLEAADIARLRPAPGDVVMLQLETPLDIVARAVATAKRAGATVVLNLSPFQPLAQDLLQDCDVIVVNETENAQLRDSRVRHRSVVVTQGAAGASWNDAHASARAERVVDTTGAGDAFAGALAAAVAAGQDRATALQQAVQAGARAVEHEGAQDWEL
jgi:ribokinase